MSISAALDLGPYWLALWFVENWGPFCLGTFLGIAFERGETRLSVGKE